MRSVPVRRAMNRISLFMGCDREMILLCLIIAVALIFVSLSWKAAIFGALFWFASLHLLRSLAKADPLMRNVYLRHIKYTRQKYYPPRSTPYVINRREYK